MSERKREFQQRLDAEIEVSKRHARSNYFMAYLAYAVAFLGGAFGSAIVALDSGGNYRVAAAIAGLLPTVALSALTTFKFGERSSWHCDKARELKKISRILLTTDEHDLLKLIDWWNNTEDELSKRAPKFGIPAALLEKPSDKAPG